MTTAPVRPVPAPSSRLTVPTVPGRRRVATGSRPTAQQLADTARRVADTYPELLAPAEFDPTTFPHDEDDKVAVVRHLPVQSQRRNLLRLPAALDRPVDALVTLLDRLPQLADAMDHEVIPLLGHLGQVGPDINQLLDSVSQLSHMASRLPKVFRRRNRQISD